MATLDHLILKVNDLDASLRFYTEVLGFSDAGRDGPFTIVKVGPDCQLQLAPWGTPGMEHYAFAVTPAESKVGPWADLRRGGHEHGPRQRGRCAWRGPDPVFQRPEPAPDRDPGVSERRLIVR